jgi:hypothetical protein
VVCPVIAPSVRVFVKEGNDIDNSLWVFLLLLLRNAIGLKRSLPFPGKALEDMLANALSRAHVMNTYRELASLLVVSHMSYMYGVFGS